MMVPIPPIKMSRFHTPAPAVVVRPPIPEPRVVDKYDTPLYEQLSPFGQDYLRQNAFGIVPSITKATYDDLRWKSRGLKDFDLSIALYDRDPRTFEPEEVWVEPVARATNTPHEGPWRFTGRRPWKDWGLQTVRVFPRGDARFVQPFQSNTARNVVPNWYCCGLREESEGCWIGKPQDLKPYDAFVGMHGVGRDLTEDQFNAFWDAIQVGTPWIEPNYYAKLDREIKRLKNELRNQVWAYFRKQNTDDALFYNLAAIIKLENEYNEVHGVNKIIGGSVAQYRAYFEREFGIVTEEVFEYYSLPPTPRPADSPRKADSPRETRLPLDDCRTLFVRMILQDKPKNMPDYVYNDQGDIIPFTDCLEEMQQIYATKPEEVRVYMRTALPLLFTENGNLVQGIRLDVDEKGQRQEGNLFMLEVGKGDPVGFFGRVFSILTDDILEEMEPDHLEFSRLAAQLHTLSSALDGIIGPIEFETRALNYAEAKNIDEIRNYFGKLFRQPVYDEVEQLWPGFHDPLSERVAQVTTAEDLHALELEIIDIQNRQKAIDEFIAENPTLSIIPYRNGITSIPQMEQFEKRLHVERALSIYKDYPSVAIQQAYERKIRSIQNIREIDVFADAFLEILMNIAALLQVDETKYGDWIDNAEFATNEDFEEFLRDVNEEYYDYVVVPPESEELNKDAVRSTIEKLWTGLKDAFNAEIDALQDADALEVLEDDIQTLLDRQKKLEQFAKDNNLVLKGTNDIKTVEQFSSYELTAHRENADQEFPTPEMTDAYDAYINSIESIDMIDLIESDIDRFIAIAETLLSDPKYARKVLSYDLSMFDEFLEQLDLWDAERTKDLESIDDAVKRLEPKLNQLWKSLRKEVANMLNQAQDVQTVNDIEQQMDRALLEQKEADYLLGLLKRDRENVKTFEELSQYLTLLQDDAEGVPVGLANVGNSCFVNAAIQMLFNISELTSHVLGAEFDAKTPVLAINYQKLINQIRDLQEQHVFPRVLDKKMMQKFANVCVPGKGQTQQDAEEFMKNILLAIRADSDFSRLLQEEGVTRENDEEISGLDIIQHPMGKLMRVESVSVLSCDGNSYFSKRRDNGTDIQVPFVGNNLTECIAAYLKPETVEYDPYSECVKEIFLTHLSDYFMVLLKRPPLSSGSFDLSPIEVPLDLDTNQFVKGSGTYQLIGTIQKVGKSRNAGHYIAYVKIGEVWYQCDDARVMAYDQVPVDEIESSVFFVYHRNSGTDDEEQESSKEIPTVKLEPDSEEPEVKSEPASEEEEEPSETEEQAPESAIKTKIRQNILQLWTGLQPIFTNGLKTDDPVKLQALARDVSDLLRREMAIETIMNELDAGDEKELDAADAITTLEDFAIFELQWHRFGAGTEQEFPSAEISDAYDQYLESLTTVEEIDDMGKRIDAYINIMNRHPDQVAAADLSDFEAFLQFLDNLEKAQAEPEEASSEETEEQIRIRNSDDEKRKLEPALRQLWPKLRATVIAVLNATDDVTVVKTIANAIQKSLRDQDQVNDLLDNLDLSDQEYAELQSDRDDIATFADLDDFLLYLQKRDLVQEAKLEFSSQNARKDFMDRFNDAESLAEAQNILDDMKQRGVAILVRVFTDGDLKAKDLRAKLSELSELVLKNYLDEVEQEYEPDTAKKDLVNLIVSYADNLYAQKHRRRTETPKRQAVLRHVPNFKEEVSAIMMAPRYTKEHVAEYVSRLDHLRDQGLDERIYQGAMTHVKRKDHGSDENPESSWWVMVRSGTDAPKLYLDELSDEVFFETAEKAVSQGYTNEVLAIAKARGFKVEKRTKEAVLAAIRLKRKAMYGENLSSKLESIESDTHYCRDGVYRWGAIDTEIFGYIRPLLEYHWDTIEANESWKPIFKRLQLTPEMDTDMEKWSKERQTRYFHTLSNITTVLDHMHKEEAVPIDLYERCNAEWPFQ